MKSGVEILVSIILFGRTSVASAPPKLKNVCQPTKRRARAEAAAQIDRVSCPWPAGSKMNAKNGCTAVAGHVRAIRRPDDAVAESIGHLEFDRNARFAGSRPVEAAASGQDVVDQRRADDVRQELVDDDPLVVPGHEPARFGEHVAQPRALAEVVERLAHRRPSPRPRPPRRPDGTSRWSSPSARSMSTTLLWKHRNAACSPPMMTCSSFRGSGMIAAPLRGARQVFEAALGGLLDLELHAVVGIVEMGVGDRSAPVDRVEIEAWRSASWATAQAASRHRVSSVASNVMS